MSGKRPFWASSAWGMWAFLWPCFSPKPGLTSWGGNPADKVEQINAGLCPIGGEEPGLAERLAEVAQAGRLRATTDYACLQDRDVGPHLAWRRRWMRSESPADEALRSCARAWGPVMKEGALVIVESTIAPRTMQDVVLPLLEETSGKRATRASTWGIARAGAAWTASSATCGR